MVTKDSYALQATLLTLTLLSARSLIAQTSYPIQGQPQGGDRRGSYYYTDEEAQKVYSQSGTIPRLYTDPKLYLHNMTVLARVERVGRGFGAGEMMTVGDRRYIVAGGLIVDVTDPKQPVVVNDRAPSGEVGYNKTLQKWILMRSDSCCGISIDVAQMKKTHPALNPPSLIPSVRRRSLGSSRRGETAAARKAR